MSSSELWRHLQELYLCIKVFSSLSHLSAIKSCQLVPEVSLTLSPSIWSPCHCPGSGHHEACQEHSSGFLSALSYLVTKVSSKSKPDHINHSPSENI